MRLEVFETIRSVANRTAAIAHLKMDPAGVQLAHVLMRRTSLIALAALGEDPCRHQLQ